MNNVGKFVVKKITTLDDLVAGVQVEIPESDVTIQTDNAIIQMEYEESQEEQKLTIIKPGSYAIEDSSFGTTLKKFDLRNYSLLETIDNTSQIISEGNKFFDKVEVYKKLGKPPKRALLLCSPPGVGKTAAISQVCNYYLEKDENTCVIVWDTSDVSSSSVNKFFLRKSTFSEDVKRLILVMEDIGGATVEDFHGARGADSSLLNLLDGVGSPFKGVPTFIIATTNNPEQSVGALIDRPGRFDKVLELRTPNAKETKELLAFIAKRDLTEDEEKAAEKAAKEQFSIAHLQEIVVRSLLDDISFGEAVDQLTKLKKRYASGFHDVKEMGIGINR